MTPDQRSAVLALLKLDGNLPDHGLRIEGVPFVSGPVRRLRLNYQVPGGRRLSAWVLRPNAGSGPWPGLIALHPHSERFSLGGEEVAGQCGQREHHYGVTFAARGFCVLCPDLPGFGQQQAPPGMPEGRLWEEHWMSRALAEGRSLLSETIDQLRCAVSALLSYECTADRKVAAVGYGVGARTAAWLAFCDQRVGGVWMHAGLGQHRVLLGQGRLLPRHNLLPGLFSLGLDQADIVADILPRPVGVSWGSKDRIATTEAVAPVLATLKARAADVPGSRLELLEGDYDHRFPDEVQRHIAERLLAWNGP